MSTSHPPDPAAGPALSPEQGRVPTMAALLSLLALTSLPFLAGLLQGQTAGLSRGVLSMCGTAFLLGMVWRGSVWAWRLTVSFGVTAGLLVFIVGMLSGSASWRGWVVSAAGLGYLGLSLALVGAPVIRAFLDTRWAARHSRRAA